MQVKLFKREHLVTVIVTVAAFLAVVGVVTATTIGTNVSTVNITASGTSSVTGNATSSGFLVVGTTNPQNNMAAGDLLLGGNATTTGDLVISGGDLNKDATALTIGGALTVTGAGSYSSTLAVTGASTLTGNVTMSGTATVAGNATSSGYLVVGTANPTNNMAAGDLLIGNKATSTVALWVGSGGAAAINMTGGDIYVQNDAEVDGALTVGSTLTVTSASTFNGALTLGDAVADAITVNGAITFANAATSTGNLVLGVSAWDAPTSTLTVLGGLHVFSGVATSSDAIWVGSGGIPGVVDLASGDLYVQGDTELDGVLNVGGKLTATGTELQLFQTNTPTACTTSNEGSIYYDSDANSTCFCDGTNWVTSTIAVLTCAP